MCIRDRKQGDPSAALDTLAAGLELYPNNAGARYLAGTAALQIDQPERALAEFAQVKDKQAFYKAFREFLKTPLEAQLKMLGTLKD